MLRKTTSAVLILGVAHSAKARPNQAILSPGYEAGDSNSKPRLVNLNLLAKFQLGVNKGGRIEIGSSGG